MRSLISVHFALYFVWKFPLFALYFGQKGPHFALYFLVLAQVKNAVYICAFQRILEHTLGALELTKIHQKNAFS